MPAMTDYIELHARSAFSFLEGASVPEEFAESCAAQQMPAMALLDRDGVYGAPRFYFAAKKLNLKAHIGAEITSLLNSLPNQKMVGRATPSSFGDRVGSPGFPSSWERVGTERSTGAPSPRLGGPPLSREFRDRVGTTTNTVGAPSFPSSWERVGTAIHNLLPRISLLCASRVGYQNLCRLITRTKLRAPKYPASLPKHSKFSDEQLLQSLAVSSLADLAEFADGLICITGGDEGPLSHALINGGVVQARHTLELLISIYGRKNVYVELQRHYNREQEARNHAAISLAHSLGLPLLATQGAQYAKPEERQILDVFTCIRNHRRLDDAGHLLANNSERYIKSPQEMLRLFADLPEATANTVELSSRLEFTLENLGYEFPRYPVGEGETMDSFLRERTFEGARDRYLRPGQSDLWQRARRQIERELVLIERLKLAGYFLIVWDIVQYCRRENILVQGRGSAANSAVCYSLGITAVDPVGMELLFERFLSEERGEWPDIDLDLPSGDQREKAIQYVYERYGKLGAAMTANVITYRGRSAAREVGKSLGFDEETLGRLTGLVSAWEYKDPGDTLDRQFRDAGFDLRHPRIRKFFELCLAIQDLPRHLGQHSGGMVICQGQLDSIVPLEPATMPGRVVVQWDKEDCADLGIVKVDLLGLGMMAVLEESITLISDHYKEDVNLAKLPADDPTVYGTLQKADTVGMFQIESRAQMSCLPRLHPTCFYDIVVQVAIIRPGPIVGQMVNPYLMRRQGRQKVVYPHPSLEPVLERTLGVPLFQEQLLRVAMIAAGFTGGEAEELRRAFGFKRSEKRMRGIEVKLRAGMERNGITGAAQEEILQSITSFALYGFPESHAASFALIAYASAWLKCHHLVAFTAALLNNQPMGFYSPATIVKDAQRHGLKVKPIDVTVSEWACTLEKESKSFTTETQSTRRISDPVLKGHALRRAETVSHSNEPASAGGRKYNDEEPQGLKPDIRSQHSGTPEGVPLQRKFVDDAQGAPLQGKFVDDAEGVAFQSSSPDDLKTYSCFALRMGLRFAKGLREESARAIVRERNRSPFTSIADLAYRVPELRRDEMVLLASIGALNTIDGKANKHPLPKVKRPQPKSKLHRRDALWQVERVSRFAGPLLDAIPENDTASPLAQMTAEERLVADFHGTGLTVGPHPLAYRRNDLQRAHILSANDLIQIPNGRRVRTAGCVIARQRPGTAKGFVFLSLEDETGISNAIITPDLLDQNRVLILSEKFLLLEGILQNQEGVVSVKVDRVRPLREAYEPEPVDITDAAVRSHDFH